MFETQNESIVKSSPVVGSYKKFSDLKIGDKLYKYTSKKILEYHIVDIQGVDEVSVDWSYNHQKKERTDKYIDIYYQEKKNKINKIIISLNKSNYYDWSHCYTYGSLFSDKRALSYYVQYMCQWRKQRIEKFKEKIAKEQQCIDNYKKLWINNNLGE